MELLELGKNPISDDAPAGADSKYEPEYEELEAEVGKLSNPSSTGGVNWDTVAKLCETILAEKSKDIKAANYLVVALLHTQKVDGLVKGMEFLKVFLETFWEDLFPAKKRMRGRKNAVEWFFNQGEAFFTDFEPPPMTEEANTALMENFDAINNFLSDKMEDPPFYRSFMETLNTIPVQVKDEPKPDAPAAAAPGALAPAAAPAAPSELASDQDAKKAVTAALKIFKQVVGYHLEADPSKPIAYSLNRLAAWMPVEQLPPNEGGVTKIPAPPAQVRTVLENLYAEGEWENLLKAAETKVAQFLFWLDLSRMVYEALGQLGEDYEDAQKAVAKETGAFIGRLKGIDSFSFADETPFADPDTRKWIAEVASAASGGGGGGAPAAPEDSEEAKVQEEFENAKKMAKSKNLPEAVELLQEKLLTSGSGKSKMMWRMALARLLLSAKKVGPAQPHLEQVLADIKTYGLEDWDPQLALEGYKVVLSAIRFLKDEKSIGKTREVFDSISRISPGEALRLEK